MRSQQFRKWDRQRAHAAFNYDMERVNKTDLQAELAKAAKNTKFDAQLEEFMRVVGPLLKGKRH